MRNGVLPQRLSPLLMAVRRMSSQAQIRAAARWNCWSVSSRSVYRISTVTPFSPERPSTDPLQPPQAERVGGQAQVGFGLAAARGEPEQIGDGVGRLRCVRGDRTS